MRHAARHLVAAVLGVCAWIGSTPAHAQDRARTSSATSTREHEEGREHRHHRTIGRLAAAVAQGSSDEVVIPVTEVRVRRRSPAEARAEAAPPVRLCLRRPVEVRRLRGRDAPRWTGSLTDCAGRPTLRAMAALALLAQPRRMFAMNLQPAMNELRRMAPAAGYTLVDESPPQRSRARGRARGRGAVIPEVPRDPHTHDPVVEVTPGARAIHPRLVQLLAAVVEHFPGHAVEIVSGYRPGDGASRHAHARAIDFRLQGVRNETLRDFARTLPDAGVGYYPNSVFIHLDVRDHDDGRVFWTDYSGPGETPRYGSWPPTDRDVQSEVDYLVTRAEEQLNQHIERERGAPSQR